MGEVIRTVSHRARLIGKLAVSFGLLAFLVHRIGPGRLADAFGGARPGYLALAFLVLCSDSLVRTYNWNRVLATRGEQLPFSALFRAFMVGGFFGWFVPSSIGTDAGRTVALVEKNPEISMSRTASSIVMLNLTGLWALGVVFLAGLGGMAALSGVPSGVAPLAALALAASVAVPALLWTRGEAVPGSWREKPVLSWLAHFVEALTEYRDVRGRLLPAFLVALVNQSFAVLVFYLVFRATGAELDPLYFPVLVPAVGLSRLIPASVAGFGAEQAAVVVVFGWAGVAASEAMAASLLLSLLSGIFMAGCGLYFTGENLRALLRGPLEGADDVVAGE